MSELTPETLTRLYREAQKAQRRAYAPYSKFSVGAAILTDRGRVLSGCNVENASYGLSNCAERVAIGQCVAEDAGLPIICVVVGPHHEPLTPCGACRQVLLEFNPEMCVVCFGSEGDSTQYTARDLLPHSFGASDLAEQ